MQGNGLPAVAAAQNAPTAPARSRLRDAAPTAFVTASIYTGWLALTAAYHALPWWVILPCGGWLIAWHSSLQHEAVHGHISHRSWLNAALAWPPLGLWMPYGRYRDSHLAHHRTPQLTDPEADPESWYVTPERWATLPPPARLVLAANNTLAGRVLIGPLLAVGRFWTGEARRLIGGDSRSVRAWLLHLMLCVALLAWVTLACGIPFLDYLLLIAWPGLSLTLLRSFAEHRPAGTQSERSAIVLAGPLTRLLFLNNNLHALHHARPELPWHALPAAFRRDRATILAGNGGYLFGGGYLELARRFAIVPKDPPAHPTPAAPDDHLR